MMHKEVFFHGTRVPFRKGGYLLPRRWHEGAGTTAPVTPGRKSPQDAGDYVYVTTSLTVAWVYAWCASGRGKPRVLTVQPVGLSHDPEHSPRMQAYRCESAKVLAVDDRPIITEQEAREGWAA